MAHAERLSPAALAEIERQLGSRQGRDGCVRPPHAPPTHLGESFPLWTLPLAAIDQRARSVREKARTTAIWHHQLRSGDRPSHYARSRTRDGTQYNEVIELVRSGLAGAIDQAVDWIDDNVGEGPVVRLLHIPAYLTTVFWLEDERQDLFLLIDAPARYRDALGEPELIAAGDFLGRLIRLPHIRGALPPRSSVAAEPVEATHPDAGVVSHVGAVGLPMLCLLALLVLGLLGRMIGGESARPYCFLLAMFLMACFFAALGIALGRGGWGVVIDDRNCMSASKLQACAWTILILSAVMVAISFNMADGLPDPLNIHLPSPLLTAMGISAASLAAAPAILSLKTQLSPSVSATAGAGIARLPAGDGVIVPPRNLGTLMTNMAVDEARWTDLVTGDEVGNFAAPDLGKIQQLLVTLLLLLVYAVETFDALGGVKPVTGLPSLDPSFIWLLGVSHASYLAYKAAPHTSTA